MQARCVSYARIGVYAIHEWLSTWSIKEGNEVPEGNKVQEGNELLTCGDAGSAQSPTRSTPIRLP